MCGILRSYTIRWGTQRSEYAVNTPKRQEIICIRGLISMLSLGIANGVHSTVD